MAPSKKPRYVDTSNPELAIDCPHCGLVTARFIEQCRNCGYKLWPSGEVASAAFQAWRETDAARTGASRFDLEVPVEIDNLVDYEARAHELGIHLFPTSNWPFTICVGFFLLFLALVPFPTAPRIVLAVLGAVIFLWGVIGWVVFEDTRMFPQDAGASGHEVQH